MPEDGLYGKGWAMAGVQDENDDVFFIVNDNAVEHSFRHLANKAFSEATLEHLGTARGRILDMVADRNLPRDVVDPGDDPDQGSAPIGDDPWF